MLQELISCTFSDQVTDNETQKELRVHIWLTMMTGDRCRIVLPGLLASPSSTCSSVHSARECSRQSCRKRACVRLTLFNRDSRATVCSHSFHPLNQLAKTPT